MSWAVFLNVFLHSLSLLPPPLYCLSALELHHELLICLGLSPDKSTCFPEYWDELLLFLEDAVLKDLRAFLSSFTHQSCLLLCTPTYQFLE